MDSGYDLSDLFAALKAEIKEWVEVRVKLLQLQVYEKTAVAGSFLIYGIIVINVLFFAFLFAFLALGFLIGKWINSVAGGFAIISFFYLLILFLLFIFHKSIFTGLQNLFLKSLNPEPENESPVL